MKTKAVRLYGKNDLRLEEFELPEIKDDEILAKVVSDSICMSSYKVAIQGANHKRVPDDVNENPTIIGHEFTGEILKVGKKWQDQFKPGDKYSLNPAINYPYGPIGLLSCIGYSYKYCGGDATYVIFPHDVMDMGCLLKYEGEAYYPASLSEPLCCVISALHASYHTKPNSFEHIMGIKEGGKMALLAGVGPMGLAMINYVLNREDRHPSLFVVTDINQQRLDRAASLYTKEFAAERGIDLRYVNTSEENSTDILKEFTGGTGYDDVVVMAPVPKVVEQADALLAYDGCLNFFSGPADSKFSAIFNFYNVHYSSTHVVGTTGGTPSDLKEALYYLGKGLDPAGLVTHIGGLDAVAHTTNNLPQIPGGKKLIYTHINMPLTAIEDFRKKGTPLFTQLANICDKYQGLWNLEAERYLLAHASEL
ncbi:MAG: zinc-binding dehydrogenase [Alistipes sp.]|nr:zinc-binding dehydrogenase [Candidatus Alistipes equi]